MTTFTAETYQNEYLPAGGTEVDAIVTVTCSGGGAAAGADPRSTAEVIIVDVSGSMHAPAEAQGRPGGHRGGDRLPPRRRRSSAVIAGHSDARRGLPDRRTSWSTAIGVDPERGQGER